MWPNPQETADLATFPEEILNGKFNFLYSAMTHFNIRDNITFNKNTNTNVIYV